MELDARTVIPGLIEEMGDGGFPRSFSSPSFFTNQ
jgi:hypothetical protein